MIAFAPPYGSVGTWATPLTCTASRRHRSGVGRAFLLSIGQLGDRVVLAVLARSLAVTLGLLALPGVAYWYGVRRVFGGIGVDPHGWATAIAIVLSLVTGWLLFRVVAIGVVGVFADAVVAAVERRHYPAALATARPVATARALRMATTSGLRTIVVNLAVLPVALLLILTGVALPLLFLLANGWLLGRDLGDMVAVRHLPAAALPHWRRRTRIPRFVLGLGIAALFLVPVLGLLAPVIGAAMATHLYHRSPA